MIYFLKCAEFIKIGFVNTEHIDAVRSRVQQFEIGNPFEIKVLAVMAGSQAEEYRLHKRFSDLRVKGEWFRFEGELLRFVGDEGILEENLNQHLKRCRVCRNQFLPPTKDSVYCSVSCSKQRVCPMCDKPFFPSRERPNICSPQCYLEMLRTSRSGVGRVPR